MHSNDAISLTRIDRFVREWIAPAVFRDRRELEVESYEAPGEPIDFEEAVVAPYRPHALGEAWGRPWGTTWFHVTGALPKWNGSDTRVEVVVDLGFSDQLPGFQAEGAAWSATGELLKGIAPRNRFVPLPKLLSEKGKFDFYVEGASNPDVPGGEWTRPTKMGDKATAGDTPLYELASIAVVAVDLTVEALLADVRALRGLVDTLPEVSPRRAQIIEGLEEMCDAVSPDDVGGTAQAGRDILAPLLRSPAGESEHRVYAVGHAHIDSAWLWPTRETERKVGRTVGNVLALMDEHPEFTFAFSSAQQYAWIKEKYPELYERLKQRVAEGRIIPVGGMWVESDTNMVGGEAMVRQFLVGKGFFQEEFGVEPTSVWLPDSFGYTGAFPQIAHLAGLDDFLTQKLSWNDTNKVPHSTFWWEGIDGTRVFTHFPPVDTYNSDLSAKELKRASDNFREKRIGNRSLAPFGWGDGGGGPTREMVLQGKRARDLEGSPRVVLSTPDDFFADSRAELAERAPTWVGEMYLEYHRGTYTAQQRTKKGNRRSENLLRAAEYWCAKASIETDFEYPYEALHRAWETVLLQQFHDILPGSSIAWVHREAEANYERLENELTALTQCAVDAIASGGENETIELLIGSPASLYAVDDKDDTSATLTEDAEGWVLENGGIAVHVGTDGLISSAVYKATGREAIPEGGVGNEVELFQDIPNNWEAWDIERHYKRVPVDAQDSVTVEPTIAPSGGPALRVTRLVSDSVITQLLWVSQGDDPTLSMQTDVEWHEKQKLLKLAFALDLHTLESEAETQFGYVRRPVHDNTSWDAAQFEGVSHRWIRVSEPGFGVSLANDGTYGHDISRIRTNSGVGTSMRVSLLRAPLFPDPKSDQGNHSFRHDLTLGASVEDAYCHGFVLNMPTFEASSSAMFEIPLVRVQSDAAGKLPILLESVKLAEDASGDVIVRIFEPLGRNAEGTLRLGCEFIGVEAQDLLERPLSVGEGAVPVEVGKDNSVNVRLKPFQIGTLRIKR